MLYGVGESTLGYDVQRVDNACSVKYRYGVNDCSVEFCGQNNLPDRVG